MRSLLANSWPKDCSTSPRMMAWASAAISRGRGFAGANGPDRFVGDHHVRGLLGGNLVEGAQALAAQHVVGESGFALFEHFADADDGDESRFERGLEFEIDGVVGLAEILAAFGVSDDDVGDADGDQHAGADFAGVSAFLLPVHVLRADGNVGALRGMDGNIERKISGADYDFVAVVTVDQRQEFAEEVAGFVGRFVHLPVGGDEFFCA